MRYMFYSTSNEMVDPTFVNCPGLRGRRRTVRKAVRCSAEQLGIGKGYTRAVMLVQKLQRSYPALESMTPAAAECLAALLWEKKSSINFLVSFNSAQQRAESQIMRNADDVCSYVSLESASIEQYVSALLRGQTEALTVMGGYVPGDGFAVIEELVSALRILIVIKSLSEESNVTSMFEVHHAVAHIKPGVDPEEIGHLQLLAAGFSLQRLAIILERTLDAQIKFNNRQSHSIAFMESDFSPVIEAVRHTVVEEADAIAELEKEDNSQEYLEAVPDHEAIEKLQKSGELEKLENLVLNGWPEAEPQDVASAPYRMFLMHSAQRRRKASNAPPGCSRDSTDTEEVAPAEERSVPAAGEATIESARVPERSEPIRDRTSTLPVRKSGTDPIRAFDAASMRTVDDDFEDYDAGVWYSD
ncbi:hypothetical protein NDN08_004208 [Rhodosorus marinus]|uniref:Uncharacterized protein n=1 Tax=Rhodosorus marinus TaxID=101924 RepID=A0AAV8UL93_9RHOD|nr:hypothetical protein NDN08_004208 [Rhodosorus marinus]